MARSDKILVSKEDTGLDRRQYLSIIATLGGVNTLAGCSANNETPSPTEQPGGETDTDTPGTTTATETPEQTPKRGGSLVSTIEASPFSLDLHHTGFSSAVVVVFQMTEQLFRINRDLNVSPWLAENVELSDDAMTWDIKLREGVMFHPPHKHEMLAEDVVFNFEKITDPDYGSGQVNALIGLENISEVDDYNIRLEFSEPSVDVDAWLSFFGWTIQSPESISGDEIDPANHPVGTGPFKFEEWEPGSHLSISKFEDYWEDDKPYLDDVTFRPISEPSVQVTELTQGNVDILRDTPPNFIDRLNTNNKVTVTNRNASGFRMFQINTADEPTDNRAEGLPTTNRKVRQAINEALDRGAFVEIVEGGFGTPTQSWFPPMSKWHIDYNPYSMGANPSRSKELLQEAGMSPPVKINILSTPAEPTLREMGRVAESNLANAGFDPNLQEMELGNWATNLLGFTYDISPNFFPGLTDPALLQNIFDTNMMASQPYNEGNNSHERAFELWAEGASSTDEQERMEIYTELQKLLIDDAAQAVLYHPQHVHTTRNSVKNYRVHPHLWHYELKDVWLDR